MLSKISKYLLIGLFTIKQPFYAGFNRPDSPIPGYNPEISIFIEESIIDKLTYRSWTGVVPGDFLVTDHNVLYSITPSLRAGVGGQYNRTLINDLDKVQVRGILEYKLW